MNITEYTKMNYEELGKEIEKQKKKIKTTQDVIKLLEKLQLAEKSKSPSPSSNNVERGSENGDRKIQQ